MSIILYLICVSQMYNCVVDCCGVSTRKGSTLPDHNVTVHWWRLEENTGRGMLDSHPGVHRLGCHQHRYLDLVRRCQDPVNRQQDPVGQDVMIR